MNESYVESSMDVTDSSIRSVYLRIRKLRKRLRQIEKLERLERELCLEEERKIFAKDKCREELKELVKEHEALTTVKDEEQVATAVVESENVNVDYSSTTTCAIDTDNHEVFNTNGHHHVSHHHLVDTDDALKLGFDENGEITADLLIADDFNGPSHVTVVEKNEEDTKNIPKKTTNAKAKKVKSNKTSSASSSALFQNLNLKMELLEGHHHDTCAIDLHGDYVLSGGRDTSLKLWLATTQEELKSIGGHEASITGVKFLKDQPFSIYPNAVTSSYDCSLKIWNLEQGNIEKSIYVYSPVICLDYSNGNIAIGTEGGKVELYSVVGGEQLYSVNAYDQLVSAIKILPDGKIASGSTDGILKIFDPKSTDAEKTEVFVLDPDLLNIRQALQSDSDVTQSQSITLSMTKISCIEAYKDLILYGDDGFNIKALDYKKGTVLKMRNNLKEYSPTEALYVGRVKGGDYLFSVGSDVDSGDGFTNVRSLPDFGYMGTIRDLNVNSGAITSFCLEEVNSKIRFITGGAQLRTWDEIEIKRRATKRKSSSEDVDDLIPCKFVCTYTEPCNSEPESDFEENNASQSESSKESSTIEQSRNEKRPFCQIL